MQKIVVFAAFLLGITGKSSIHDRDFPGSPRDIPDERAESEKIPGIQRMIDKKKRRGGGRDKNLKMNHLFDPEIEAKRGEKRNSKRINKRQRPQGAPENMKTPRQEEGRKDGPSRKKPGRPDSRRKRKKKSPGGSRSNRKRPKPREPIAHVFAIKDGKGNIIHLDKEHFPNARIFLIVNIASESDLMWQVAELENLYETYGARGLEIIAFPSNSFNEEPLQDNEIQLLLREQYHVTYPVMAKCDVNGDDELPLYGYLKRQAVGGVPKVPTWSPLEESGLKEKDIQWNFDKFLVYILGGKERVTRFPFDFSPSSFKKHIERTFDGMSKSKAKKEL